MSKNENDNGNGTGEDEIENEAEHTPMDDSGGDDEKGGKAGKYQKELTKALAPLSVACREVGKQWKPSTRALDVIFSGRFLASSTLDSKKIDEQDTVDAFQQDAAVAFAHLFSVNAVSLQADYFTGMDDLGSKRSSCHIGSNELASATMAGYVSIDLNMVERGVGKDATTEAVECYLRCLLDAEPTGRQATMANKTPMFFFMATIHGMPTNLSGAYERPVSVQPGSDLSLSETAVARLGSHWQNLERFYAGDDRETFTPECAAAICLSERIREIAPGIAQHVVDSRKDFFAKIMAGVTKGLSESGSGRTGGRFLDVWFIKFVAPSCLNRDDMNQPKTIDVGGFTRLRFSSQCYKRAVRRLVHERYMGAKGRFTKRIPGEIMRRLGLEPTNQVAKLVVGAFFDATITGVDVIQKPMTMFGRKDASPASSSLVFLGDEEIASMTQLLRGAWESLAPVGQAAYEALEAIRLKIESGDAAPESGTDVKTESEPKAARAKAKGVKAKAAK